MAKLNVQLPGLLSPVVAGRLNFPIEAPTLRGALETIRRDQPCLGLHLFAENGELRQHVLCFLNGTNTRWLDDLELPVKNGDTLLFMQAVSGG